MALYLCISLLGYSLASASVPGNVEQYANVQRKAVDPYQGCQDSTKLNCTDVQHEICSFESAYLICPRTCNLCDRNPAYHPCRDYVQDLDCADLINPCDDSVGLISCPLFCGVCSEPQPPPTTTASPTTSSSATAAASSPTLSGACAPNPCLNGGFCSDKNGGFMCLCPPGFVHPVCSPEVKTAATTTTPMPTTTTPMPTTSSPTTSSSTTAAASSPTLGACALNPCLNGGYCKDTNGGFMCLCPPGFEHPVCSPEVKTATTSATSATSAATITTTPMPTTTITTTTTPMPTTPATLDGGWGTWGSYGACSKTCGVGTHIRHRACDTPAPAHGGKACLGDSTASHTCHSGFCPVDGGWGTWGSYGACSKTCGGGTRGRHRRCDTPARAHHGKACVGISTSSQTCQSGYCPVDGGWGTWQNYGHCSKTCGGGTRIRRRDCNTPSPAHGGKACVGDSISNPTCQSGSCPDSNCYIVGQEYLYVGHTNKTEHGRPCLKWSHSHQSEMSSPADFTDGETGYHSYFCRESPNLDGHDVHYEEHTRPWCFTGHHEHDWGYCDIPVCSGSQVIVG